MWDMQVGGLLPDKKEDEEELWYYLLFSQFYDKHKTRIGNGNKMADRVLQLAKDTKISLHAFYQFELKLGHNGFKGYNKEVWGHYT